MSGEHERSIQIQELLQLLPHRYPFLLVDRIVDMEPGVRISGIKDVTVNEPLFGKNGGGGLIMPALLIIEAMAQTGAVLLMIENAPAPQKLVYFASVNEATWQGVVRPDRGGERSGRVRPGEALWPAMRRRRIFGTVSASA